MAEMIDVLHKIIQDTMSAQKPADVAFGTVTGVSPLAVRIEGTMQDLPAAALILTSAVTKKVVQIQGGTVVINEGLKSGDKVILLRASRGQRFVILSKTQEGGSA